MRIHAFGGIIYDAARGDAGALAAPPYDQIGAERARELHDRDPHHFSWLTRPTPGDSGDTYQEATRLHREWLASRVLERQARPGLYPYVIELAQGGRRLGVTALVGIEPEESGAIRAHEETLAKPLADRLALLEAMRVDLEPVLLLSEDAGALDRLLEEDLARLEPLAVHEDDDGHRHLLYRLTDPERIARYKEALSGPAAIADGHHRYKVARKFAEGRGLVGREDDPAAAKLAVITSLSSPELSIQPIHRGLAEAVDLAPAAAHLAGRERAEASSGSELAEAVAAAEQPAVGVLLHGGEPEIWRLSPATGAAAERLSPGARDLPVALLHDVLLRSVGLGEGSATDGTVSYRSDPEILWRQVQAGELAVGVWLPPMEPAQFAAAIAHGDMLPPKSTRFLPKVVSGLVWADHQVTFD